VTLRVRLLLGLVFLAAIGLVFAGVVTYRQTRADLLGRVTHQLRATSHAPYLFFAGVDAPNDPNQISNALLPPGTWAQLRAADTGEAIPGFTNRGVLNTGGPVLSSTVTPGTIFTVNDPHYRVIASDPDVNVVTSGFTVRAFLVVAIPLADADHTLHHLLLVEYVVILTVLVAMAILAWWVVKLGLRPLEDMERTADAIAAGDLSQRVEIVDPNTEVGRLGIAMNQMMQQIETAFAARAASEARLRRFVGDASHELRTPLTSIRGYAELFRRGAADRPEDLAKAMRRIEEEANRMGVLVDDMLLLARLDQGRPLERQPVDLTRITRDAVDDFRAVAPDRPIDFAPAGSVFVPGDEPRLRQVLGNLLQNARRHTPPATPVHVRVFAGSSEAVIEVADEGSGMSPEDASRVFERFWRSDPSRARASGGAGLGLAIVAAIADAHGGRAEVQTALGQGATFRIRLPLRVPIVSEQRADKGVDSAPQAEAPPVPQGAPAEPPLAQAARAESPAATVPVADVEDAGPGATA
jgi:two-component system OmpR family sensor kinase